LFAEATAQGQRRRQDLELEAQLASTSDIVYFHAAEGVTANLEEGQLVSEWHWLDEDRSYFFSHISLARCFF
jgi:hypothetical protein